MACSGESNQEVGRAVVAAIMTASQNNQANTADPVNVVTGAFLHSEHDIAFPSQRLVVALTRHYNNQLHKLDGNVRLHSFGPGWTHSFGLRIEKHDEKPITYIDDLGAKVVFKFDPVNGTFEAPPGSLGMLLSHREQGGFRLRQISGLTAEFNAAGRIETLIQPGVRQDSRLTFQYDAMDRLISVQGAGSRGLQFHYESDDFLIREVSDHAGRHWAYLYNESRELVEVRSPGGRVRRYEYGYWESRIAKARKACEVKSLRALRLIFPYVSQDTISMPPAQVKNCYTTEQRVYLQVDALGHQTRFEYNPFARTTGVTDPAGNTTLYCFDEAGSTTKVRRSSGATTEYVFDDRRNLLAEIDPLGHRTEYVDFKDPSRLDLQSQYGRRAIGNRSGYLEFTSSDIGRGYDTDGNRPLRRNAIGQTTRFEGYTSFGKPRRIILPDGSTILTEYEECSGFPLRQTKQLREGRVEPLQLVEEWAYDDFGNCIRHTTWAETEKGQAVSGCRVEAFEFDALGQHLIRERNWIEESGEGESFASEMNYQWDLLGRLTTLTSLCRTSPGDAPKPHIKRFVYDELSRMVCEIQPDNSAKYWEYDLNDKLLETFMVKEAKADLPADVPQDVRLRRNRWEYDALGREIKHIDPAGVITSREWDGRGLCTAVIDHLGGRTTFSYDRDSNLIEQGNDRGYRTNIDYDASGRVISRRDNLGSAVQIGRDALGRTVSIIQGESSPASEVSYSYDLRGNIAEIRFPDNTYERLTFDEFNNLVRRQRGRSSDEPCALEIHEYDGLGRLLVVYFGRRDKQGQQFRYEYDAARREVRLYDALEYVTSSLFDTEGNLIARVDAEGNLLRFAYDTVGRLLRRWSDDGSVDSTYEYEVGGSLSLSVEADIRYEWQYDQAGRILCHSQKVANEVRSLEYGYDTAGRLVSKKMDKQWWMKYSYSSSWLPSDIEIPGNSIQLEYDSNGRLVLEQWQDGGCSSYAYSEDGSLRLLQRQDGSGKLVLSQTFVRDARKRPAREVRRIGASEAECIYHYDALDRLVGVDRDEAGRSVSFRRYVYDDRNNRLEEYRHGLLHSSFQYDAANRIVLVSDAHGSSREFKHDRCGNRVADGAKLFSYDAAQRLRRVSQSSSPEPLAAYHYAPTGDLAFVETANGTNRIFYDGPQEVAYVRAKDQEVAFWNSRLDSLLAASKGGGRPLRAYTDSLDSLIGIDQLPFRQEYDQFGNTVSNEESKVRYGFCAKPYDPIAGLYYNRARFYDPRLGRFTQPDPKELIDGANTYVFARNNPLHYVDKSGFKAEQKSQGKICEIALALAFFPDQKSGRSDMVGPGLFESRGHMKHHDANWNLLGRSYIVDPGLFETRPHVEHFDANWNLVGRTYLEGPGFIESFVTSQPHFQHYNADWERSGRTYAEGPGFIESFVTSQTHFQHYNSSGERSARSYVEAPGFIESFVTSQPHFRHYA